MLFLAGGILLLLVIGGLLYRQSRQRKKTNLALSQLNRELDEANKVKARFFGILSHDLRSPVANLISFLQLQKKQPALLTEAQKTEREQKITQSAENLLEIMEGMLLWSKGQMEQFTPVKSAVPVQQLFTYIRKYYSNNDGIRFHFEAPDDLMVHTDENYLQTIMQNLTANAVKALQQHPAGSIWWKAWKEADRTFLSITDNGPGISPELAKTLFEDAAVSGGRHGLGLHIVRDLSKAIHCDIRVSAGDDGTGTRFLLTI
jgi:signal transduction histidine kinase